MGEVWCDWGRRAGEDCRNFPRHVIRYHSFRSEAEDGMVTAYLCDEHLKLGQSWGLIRPEHIDRTKVVPFPKPGQFRETPKERMTRLIAQGRR